MSPMEINRYRQAAYVLSAHKLTQMPADTGVEVAFAGRSNVGKSSVINAIADQKGLAKTSKTPGRTQQLNFFSITDDVRLVDLPGYGFAKVSREIRAHWGRTMSGYFETRQSLRGLVLIMDIRRPLTDVDGQMLDWCRAARLPVHIILNKADKLSFGAAKQCLLGLQQQIVTPDVGLQLFSALKKDGVDEARDVLDKWLFG